MNLFRQNNDPRAVDEFWEETAQEIGEPILVYGLSQYVSGGGEEGPLWGIAYLTATRLFFRHFPQHSWFNAVLMNSVDGRSEKEKRPKERDITLIWELSKYETLEDSASKEKPWRRLLFGTRSLPLRLIPKGVQVVADDAEAVTFTVEHNRNEFVSTMQRLLNS